MTHMSVIYATLENEKANRFAPLGGHSPGEGSCVTVGSMAKYPIILHLFQFPLSQEQIYLLLVRIKVNIKMTTYPVVGTSNSFKTTLMLIALISTSITAAR